MKLSTSSSYEELTGHTDPSRIYRLIFVVCHPDDEALWIGGLLHELSRFPFLKSYVLCLSGDDAASARKAEFDAARAASGYSNGIVLGGPIPPAQTPLPSVEATVEEGLRALSLEKSEIDLVITHSPYGDEHLHPHHKQAHREVGEWAKRYALPFGYFSCIPVREYRHHNLLEEPIRSGTLQVLSFARCTDGRPFVTRWIDKRPYRGMRCPRYFLQFLTDLQAKTRMLGCYPSIGLNEHELGYAMFTNPCESLYLYDDLALKPFQALVSALPSSGNPALFDYTGGWARVMEIGRLLLSKVSSRKAKQG